MSRPFSRWLPALLALSLVCAAKAGVLEVPAQFPTIQSAADAAQLNDQIHIAPGIYRENVLLEQDQVSIYGPGVTIDGRYLGPCLEVHGSWINIEGLTLVNGGTAPAQPGDPAPDGGVVLIGENITPRVLTVRACAGFGIRIEGGGLLDSCIIEGCTGPGLVAVGLGVSSTNVLPVHCIIRHCAEGFHGTGGPFHIVDSLIEGNSGDGIVCDYTPGPAQAFSRLEDNVVTDNGGAGLRILDTKADPLGVYCDSFTCILERNDVGLVFNGLKTAASGHVIRHNRSGGIDVDAGGFELNDSKVIDNGRFGVRVANSLDLHGYGYFAGLLSNTVRGNAGDGLHLDGISFSLEGGRVLDNLGDGASLDGATWFYVAHSRFLRNGHDGLENSAEDTILRHNRFKLNGGADLAGLGDGTGSVGEGSFDNVTGDGTGEDSPQELELDTATEGGTLTVPSEAFGTIQSAIDAAEPGDTIKVSKGVYIENVSITTPGLVLSGSGAVIRGDYAGPCLQVEADDVSVKGFTLRDGTSGLLANGKALRLRKLRILACSGAGVSVTGNDGLLRDVRVEGCGEGLSLTTADTAGPPSRVHSCRVTRCGTGLQVLGGPFVLEANICRDNRADGLVAGLGEADGPGPPPAAKLLRNQCLDNAGLGLAFYGPFAKGSRIEDNVLSGNDAGAFIAAWDTVIRGNVIERNRRGGAHVAGTECSFVGNRVRDNGRVGVVLAPWELGDIPVGFNLARDNEISGNAGDGLDVLCADSTIEDNELVGNLGDGLQLAVDAWHNKLRSNVVTGNGHDGLDSSGQDVLIQGNTCTGNGGADLAGAGDGRGSAAGSSGNNVIGDGSGLTSPQELELFMVLPGPGG